MFASFAHALTRERSGLRSAGADGVERVTGCSAGTRSPYCSMTSSTHLRNAFATGVRANMARRWQPRREKMRVGSSMTPVVKLTTVDIIEENSSLLRS